jgi:hypothetical protein
MFIVLFITNILILLIIKFYLKRRLEGASTYSRSLLKSITDLGYNLGISSLINSILNLLRSKNCNDFSGDTLQYYDKFTSYLNDNKLSTLSRFNFLIILLFFVLLNVVIYRLLQFSLILPIKTLINALFYTILGFDLSSYLDEIYLLYIPYMKQWLNNNLGFSFTLPEYVPEGHAWNLEDIQLVKTFNNGFEILREVRNKLSGDDVYYNEIQSMLPESSMEGNSTLPVEEGGWDWARILGVVVILTGLGFGVYYFYGDSISEYFSGESKGSKPGPSNSTGGPESFEGFNKTFQAYHRQGKPPWFGSAVNNVMLNPDGTVRWYWDQSKFDWVINKPHSGFIPSDPSAIIPSDITPRASTDDLINAVRSPKPDIVVLSPSGSSSSSSSGSIKPTVEGLNTYLPISHDKTFEVLTSGFARSTTSDLIFPAADPNLNPFPASDHVIPKGFKLNVGKSRGLSINTSVTAHVLSNYGTPGTPLTPMQGKLFQQNLPSPLTSSRSVPEIITKYNQGRGLELIDRRISTLPNSPFTPRTAIFHLGLPVSQPRLDSIVEVHTDSTLAESIPLPESTVSTPKTIYHQID